jgi:hypothetical protein
VIIEDKKLFDFEIIYSDVMNESDPELQYNFLFDMYLQYQIAKEFIVIYQ